MGILLAGGAGDIGRHRVLALLDAARLVMGDGAAATHGIDAVVHVAGSIVVSKSVADLLGDNALIEACVLAGVKRFISSSTAAVYGALASNPVAEDAPLRPISPCRSVRPVIEAVKTVSGVDFEVRHAPRRAGDPPALVAKADHIRANLGWHPRLDDLETSSLTPSPGRRPSRRAGPPEAA